MLCEMCGAESQIYKTKIEGTEMNVCTKCTKFGKVLSTVRTTPKEEISEIITPKRAPERIELIVPDLAEKIRKKREQLGMDHEKFASFINEKKSVVHKLENKELTPNSKLARKLEEKLNLTLIEEYAEEDRQIQSSKDEEVTVGDLIKIKTRKKQ